MKKNLRILWVKPVLKEEYGEYYENPYTMKAFKKQGCQFAFKKDLAAFLESGKLKPLRKGQLTNTDNMTLKESEFLEEMNDTEYAKSFISMETKLLRDGTIMLPAPIVIKFKNMYYGYAGNRRTNLALKYNIPLQVWLVERP